jgi:hypothetical protein
LKSGLKIKLSCFEHQNEFVDSASIERALEFGQPFNNQSSTSHESSSVRREWIEVGTDFIKLLTPQADLATEP